MRPSGAGAIVPHPTRGEGVADQAFDAGDEFEDEAEPEDVAPLDAEADAEADYYAAQAEEVEEPIESEFSADSLQLFLKDVGKVDWRRAGSWPPRPRIRPAPTGTSGIPTTWSRA